MARARSKEMKVIIIIIFFLIMIPIIWLAAKSDEDHEW